jgi:hypothetical protein
VPGPAILGIKRQAGSPQKGTELGGLYSPQSRNELMVCIISEDWPVWLSVLPALGRRKLCPGGLSNALNGIHTLPGRSPGSLQFISTKEKLIKKKLDVVFVWGSPRFVKQICLDLEGQRIWTTCLVQ